MNAALHYRHRYYSPAYAARVDIDGTPLLDDLARRYLPSGACVLDVGAGAGGRKHPCREPGIRLVGIDPSPLVTSNPDLDCCVCHPAEEMPFESGSFDLVFSDFTLEHLPNPEAVISEIHRVLKPGGHLVFRTVNAYHYVAMIARFTPAGLRDRFLELATRSEAFPTFYRLNTRKKIKRLLQHNGFKLESAIMVEGPPDYLAFSPVLYSLGLMYERIANSSRYFDFMKSNLIMAAAKDVDAPALGEPDVRESGPAVCV